MTAAPILVVEDNRDLALGLRVNLEEQGYTVHVAHTLADALVRLRQLRPALIVLDLALPDGDGVEWVRRLREEGNEALVLMLTARSRQDAKVLGLRVGADDYVTKPFDIEELLTRIAVLLRRQRPAEVAPAGPVIRHAVVGDVAVDANARTLKRGDVSLAVSRLGFDLLLTLLRHRGSAVTRAELMREVWGYGADVASRTLDTHIFELRKLIDPDPASPSLIRTVWRIGYRLD